MAIDPVPVFFDWPALPVGDYPYDLGAYKFKISTTSAECQTWFNRAMVWTYGFHHEEAEQCFRYAIDKDPQCSMAHWGAAYAGGPNYNKAWERFDRADLKRTQRKCHQAALAAVHLAKDPLEATLAAALAVHFPKDQGDFQHWNHAYSEAMEKVYTVYGDNLDVAALYADSLMALAPWQLWDLHTGVPREDSKTLHIQATLEKATLDPASTSHPGVLHFYVHLMELSLTPEAAVTAADHLRKVSVDAGHLNHMPGHIDLLIGDYRRCIDTNLNAICGDEKYMKFGSTTNFYTFYRLHDYTFPIYAAMFNGQFNVTMETVARMEKSLTEDLLCIPSPPMINWMEGFKSYRVHILIRFRKWNDILDLPFPEDCQFYCVTTTILHYTRTLAFSVLEHVNDTLAERDLFRVARTKMYPTRFEYPNSWDDILSVAEAMATGELEYHCGNFELAFEKLRELIRLSDNLIYAEPWGWMQPPHHTYAALQLEQGNIEEAAKTYEEDLGLIDSLPRACRHPNNVWALHGYHECLIKLSCHAEAKVLKPQLTLALAITDVPIEASCYCRGVEKKSCCGKE